MERAAVKDAKKKHRLLSACARVFGGMLLLMLVCGAVITGFALWHRSYYKISFYQETSQKVSGNIRIAVISDIHTREYGDHNSYLLQSF